jgi:hypothetical protein
VGLTLIAILTAALLLPGIVGARFLYRAAETNEVEAPLPALSTPEGIALVGGFSIAVHFAYTVCLKFVVLLPPLTPFPLADPYSLFQPVAHVQTLDAAYRLFSGLVGLCLTAVVLGFAAGRILMLRSDKSFFYGPLSEVLEKGSGDNAFITAYVISKIAEGTRLVGYQGSIVSLFRDADRFPAKVVLKDVVPFYLCLQEDRPRREESDQIIDWLVLTADEWHNIAFRVYRVEDEVAAVEQDREDNPFDIPRIALFLLLRMLLGRTRGTTQRASD